MLGNGNYRRQSYVDLERNFLNTDSEIVEEFNGDSGSTKNAKKIQQSFSELSPERHLVQSSISAG
jgi:hypothetical protein